MIGALSAGWALKFIIGWIVVSFVFAMLFAWAMSRRGDR